jgi:chorismate mutase
MEQLKPFRDQIDALDDQIIELLARRMDIVRQIGIIKARDNIAAIQPDRVIEVRERNAQNGALKGINPGLIRKIYSAIFDEAHEIEQGIAGQ